METQIEQAIRHNMMVASLIMRAINERDGWTIRLGSRIVPAQVIVTETAISFWASIEVAEDIEDPCAFICHNGDALIARPIGVSHGVKVGDRVDFEVVYTIPTPTNVG